MPTYIGYASESGSGGVSVNNDTLVGLQTDYTEAYIVIADNENQTEREIILATGVPRIRAYDAIRGGVCTSLTGEKDPETLKWTVTAGFSSNTNQDGTEDTLLPPAKKARWSWSSETIQEVIEADAINGNRIENAVGEPLLITAPVSIPIYTVTRIQEDFDPDTILEYKNHVNKKDFMGAPIGTALMTSIRDNPTNIAGREYRQVEYVIKFKLYRWSEKERDDWREWFTVWTSEQGLDPDLSQTYLDTSGPDGEGPEFRVASWASRPLNHGTKYFIAAANNDPNNPTHIREFVTKGGQPTTGNLKADGTKSGPTDKPNYLFFRHQARADFNLLDLGPFTTNPPPPEE